MISFPLVLLGFLCLCDSFHIDDIQNDNEVDGGLYLAINSLAFVDDGSNIVKRRLEINVYGAEVNLLFYFFYLTINISAS